MNPQLWVCRLADTTWPKIKRPVSEETAYVLTVTRSGELLYFAGFTDDTAQWSADKSNATTWSNRTHAEAQAQLLRRKS